jgi:prepilin-type N-terminal cleavage/methylation domain-containing protein
MTREARGTTHDERGFTLVELLVCIVVLGIIFTTLTGALIIGLRSTSNANVKFDESNAAQFTALHFTRDVQGAEDVTLNDATGSCGGAAKLKLTSDVADRIVAYAVTGSPTLQFVRRVCSPKTATPVVSVLAPVIASANAVNASCSAGCATVTLTVDQPGSPGVVSGLSFTVQASPRVSP